MRTHILRIALFAPYVALVIVMGLCGVIGEALEAAAAKLDLYTAQMSGWVNGF